MFNFYPSGAKRRLVNICNIYYDIPSQREFKARPFFLTSLARVSSSKRIFHIKTLKTKFLMLFSRQYSSANLRIKRARPCVLHRNKTLPRLKNPSKFPPSTPLHNLCPAAVWRRGNCPDPLIWSPDLIPLGKPPPHLTMAASGTQEVPLRISLSCPPLSNSMRHKTCG